MDAPALPRTADDLTEWSVFADHLLTVGDPRGEALALELALPITPTAEQLAAFHAKCPRLATSGAQLQFGYRLGHVAVLAFASPAHKKLSRAVGAMPPESGAFGLATDLLTQPAFARLEQLASPLFPQTREATRLLRRLPKTCTRLALHLGSSKHETRLVDALIEVVPPQIDTVRLSRCSPEIAARFVTGRFATVELHHVSSDFELALEAAAGVEVRVWHAYAALHPRIRLGTPESAGFLAPANSGGVDFHAHGWNVHPIAMAIPRRTLLELQARFGVIPIRSQLAHSLPDHQYVTLGAVGGLELAHATERWTVRSTEPLTVDEVAIDPNTVVELRDGARVTLGGKTLELATHDLEARFRARC